MLLDWVSSGVEGGGGREGEEEEEEGGGGREGEEEEEGEGGGGREEDSTLSRWGHRASIHGSTTSSSLQQRSQDQYYGLCIITTRTCMTKFIHAVYSSLVPKHFIKK